MNMLLHLDLSSLFNLFLCLYWKRKFKMFCDIIEIIPAGSQGNGVLILTFITS